MFLSELTTTFLIQNNPCIFVDLGRTGWQGDQYSFRPWYTRMSLQKDLSGLFRSIYIPIYVQYYPRLISTLKEGTNIVAEQILKCTIFWRKIQSLFSPTIPNYMLYWPKFRTLLIKWISFLSSFEKTKAFFEIHHWRISYYHLNVLKATLLIKKKSLEYSKTVQIFSHIRFSGDIVVELIAFIVIAAE